MREKDGAQERESGNTGGQDERGGGAQGRGGDKSGEPDGIIGT